jgi:hypothetical protein
MVRLLVWGICSATVMVPKIGDESEGGKRIVCYGMNYEYGILPGGGGWRPEYAEVYCLSLPTMNM